MIQKRILRSIYPAASSEITQIRQSPGTRFNPSRISDAPWYGMPELVKNVHDQLYATHEGTKKLAACKDYRNHQAG